MKRDLSSFWKLVIILSAVVAGVIALKGADLTPRTPIVVVRRTLDSAKQARINYLLKRSIALTVDKVVETRSLDRLEAGIGCKFVTVRFKMICRKELPFSVSSECFALVDSEGRSYRPLAQSPLFVKRGRQFPLKEGEEFKSRLAFEIPADTKANRLRFNRPE